MRHGSKRLGHASGQPIFRKFEPLQIGQVAQLRGYLPAEVIAPQAKLFEVGKVAQLGGNPPA